MAFVSGKKVVGSCEFNSSVTDRSPVGLELDGGSSLISTDYHPTIMEILSTIFVIVNVLPTESMFKLAPSDHKLQHFYVFAKRV